MTAAAWRRCGALFASVVLVYAMLTFILGMSSVLAQVTP